MYSNLIFAAMESPKSASYRIERAEHADVKNIQRIWASSFIDDTHTLLKAHEKGIPVIEELPLDLIPSWIDVASSKGMFIKAMGEDGGLLGWSSWGYYNLDGSKPQDDSPPLGVDAPVQYPEDADDPPLKRLNNITSGHLFAMYDRLCNPANKVVFAQAIAVDPKARGRGIGRAMIEYATGVADRHGALMWVHLSDSQAGITSFAKCGFVKRSEVTVNLDRYARKPCPPEREQWGRYTFRLLVRPAKGE